MTRILPFRRGKTQRLDWKNSFVLLESKIFFFLDSYSFWFLSVPFCFSPFVQCRLVGCPVKQTRHAWIQASGVRLWRCGQVRSGEYSFLSSSLHPQPSPSAADFLKALWACHLNSEVFRENCVVTCLTREGSHKRTWNWCFPHFFYWNMYFHFCSKRLFSCWNSCWDNIFVFPDV